MGERPTHPELLDYLAATFVENGWSIKKMHRLILLSNTYQQSSEIQEEAAKVDPDNKPAVALCAPSPGRRSDSRFHAVRKRPAEPENGRSAASSRRSRKASATARNSWQWQPEDRMPRKPIAAACTFSCGATCAIRCCRSSIPPTPTKAAPAASNTVTPSQSLDLMNDELVLRLGASAGRPRSER